MISIKDSNLNDAIESLNDQFFQTSFCQLIHDVFETKCTICHNPNASYPEASLLYRIET